jgi:hypothetical protein
MGLFPNPAHRFVHGISPASLLSGNSDSLELAEAGGIQMATKSNAKQRNESEIKATNLTKEDRQFIDEHGDQLSRSTQNAKWIHSPEERGDRHGQTLATRSPEVIRAWAEERGGRPATVPDTDHDGHAGVLRITFAQEGNSRLEEIGWDEWFRAFEERQLVFIYQETTTDGNQSNFFRLDSPEREDG